MYQRPHPHDEFPEVPFEFLEDNPNLPSFLTILRDLVTACLDAAHATDLSQRRSVTGYIIFFGGAAIAWKSVLQPLTATSSTEAEFYAAVTTAKVVKYLQYVLQELRASQPGPSPLYIDNSTALAMINESQPTPQAHHIKIQHFAIQQWAKSGDICMVNLPGIINPSDGMTKALSWVLHSRHARRSVGARELWFSCIACIRDSRDPQLERYDIDMVNILICSLFFVPFLSVWIEFPPRILSSQSDRT
jgi:hypothetical protein